MFPQKQIRSGFFTNELKLKLDETVSGTTYVGLAPLGSSTSSEVWQIKKIVESGGITTITWADGDSIFNNIWDDRASLVYA